ncbi:hypothetical protein LCGC14_0971070 [marine sediment metagenome]|uniref:Uncharacterized protein n=1 Tax=marine sediment metagenome TaxID=412755 RepID=A0A0F9NXT8_9ZZZZ
MMAHWHYNTETHRKEKHSHPGGNEWHEHLPTLVSYGRTSKSLSRNYKEMEM